MSKTLAWMAKLHHYRSPHQGLKFHTGFLPGGGKVLRAKCAKLLTLTSKLHIFMLKFTCKTSQFLCVLLHL